MGSEVATAAKPRDARRENKLSKISAELAAIREARTVTPTDLKVSKLGRELNHEFWREHANSDVGFRCRLLVAQWKDCVKDSRNQQKSSQQPPLPHTAQEVATGLLSKNATGQSNKMVLERAREIEEAVWEKSVKDHSVEYKHKVRFLANMLKRPHNAELQKQLLSGKLSGCTLVDRPQEEFLSPEKQAELQRLRRKSMCDSTVPDPEVNLFNPDLACVQCGNVGTRYAVLADTGSVPMDGSSGHKRQKSKKRIFARCDVCGEKWTHDDGWHI